MINKTFEITILLLLVVVASLIIGKNVYGKDKEQDSEQIECLKLTISLDKEVYQLNDKKDKIELKGILKNISEKEIILNTRFSFPSDIYISIKTDEDKILKWLPPSPPRPLTKDDFKLLKPQEEINFSFFIRNADLYDKLFEGRHKIQVKYTNNMPSEYIDLYHDKYKSQTCKDPVHSNVVFFEIHNS